jgi:predicted nucleotidyltransferase
MFNVTKMASKENELLEQFFNSQRHWHFEELRRLVKIGKPQLARWLKLFERQGIIKRVKPRGKMPYYTQDIDNPVLRTKKKLFALDKMSEMISHLASLKKAKVIILFGSFTRSDWWKESDIDIFIYGNDKNFERGKYELKLKREIQVHTAKDRKDLQKLNKLLPYIISGDFIKGSIEDLGVEIRAKI